MLKSDVQLAGEFCMKAAGQKVRERPATPTAAENLLRAQLIVEEAIETVRALGCVIRDFTDNEITQLGRDYTIETGGNFNLEGVIDGCCDLNVVVAGTMSTIGVPDLPFQHAVNIANAAKFPDGQAVPHPTVPGKYGKPDGWQPPDHSQVLNQLALDQIEGLA